MSARGRRITRAALLAAALAASSAGCATGYVLRAAYEEARILWRRQPIAALLADPALPAETRAKLELAVAVRRFAADDLGLDVGGSYTSVARVDAGQIVHVVSAAPRDRLVPYTWWFPIVGDVPYRGYFAAAAADAQARQLERDGYDTYVRPAVAFSTLGWFDDPLLSTLLASGDERLAEVIIHELLHSTIYLPGQAAFNESFATFVGHRGAQAFFVARADDARAARAGARWADALAFSTFLGEAVARLETAYAQPIEPASRAALFEALQDECARRPWQTGEYAGFWQRPVNNAVILHDRLYGDRLVLFESAATRRGGDLRAAIAWIRERTQSTDDPFAALAAAVNAG